MNEHFLALKNKFNNEQDILKKNVEIMEEEVKKEENANKQRNHKIEILKREYEEISGKYQDYKEMTLKQMKDLETKLFTETHTKDVLTLEKQVLFDKINKLKNDNQNMGRSITKDKYHNNRDEIEKKRRKDLDTVQEDINMTSDKLEVERTLLEEEMERNADPNLLKRQNETTMNLQSDHTKIKNDITVATNRITDLTTRKDMLNKSIAEGLKEKRRVDKHNMELEDKISGRNVTEAMQKQRHKNEERKMRIKYENNVDNLKRNGVMLMEKTADEEAKSKDLLDQKLKME